MQSKAHAAVQGFIQNFSLCRGYPWGLFGSPMWASLAVNVCRSAAILLHNSHSPACKYKGHATLTKLFGLLEPLCEGEGVVSRLPLGAERGEGYPSYWSHSQTLSMRLVPFPDPEHQAGPIPRPRASGWSHSQTPSVRLVPFPDPEHEAGPIPRPRASGWSHSQTPSMRQVPFPDPEREVGPIPRP